MMAPKIEALARRAIACPGWRWMPGMLALPPKADRCQRDGQTMVGRLPDLGDPLTVQAVALLVREAWGKPVAVWWPKNTEACCVGVGRMPIALRRFWQRRTYAEALVAALEAAP